MTWHDKACNHGDSVEMRDLWTMMDLQRVSMRFARATKSPSHHIQSLEDKCQIHATPAIENAAPPVGQNELRWTG